MDVCKSVGEKGRKIGKKEMELRFANFKSINYKQR